MMKPWGWVETGAPGNCYSETNSAPLGGLDPWSTVGTVPRNPEWGPTQGGFGSGVCPGKLLLSNHFPGPFPRGRRLLT